MKRLLYTNPRTNGTIWLVDKQGTQKIRMQFSSHFKGVAWLNISRELNETTNFEEIIGESRTRPGENLTYGQSVMGKVYSTIKNELNPESERFNRNGGSRRRNGGNLIPIAVHWAWGEPPAESQ